MSLEDISAHFSGMTSGQVRRHAETTPDAVKACRFLDLNREVSILEMAHPA
jgi:hypothetical protein